MSIKETRRFFHWSLHQTGTATCEKYARYHTRFKPDRKMYVWSNMLTDLCELDSSQMAI